MPASRFVRRIARFHVAMAIALLPAFALAQNEQKVDKKQQERLAKEQRAQYLAMSALVDAAMAGTPRSDFPIQWKSEFSLKAQENRTYVPFTITVDPATAPSPAVLYVRLTPRGATAPAAPAEKKEEGEDKGEAPVAYPFEDLHTVQLKGGAQPGRVSRAFAVPAGEYDLYVAIADNKTPGKDQMTVGRGSVLKQQVTVPDYWSTDLTSSPVILADTVNPLTAPLTQEQQVERPYVLGNMEVTPASDNSFTKKENLQMLFLVYNAQVNESGKPDLAIEYRFNQKTGETEKFFNRTEPQLFNAATLPPQFDVRAGHQVVAGQEIPLASFPEGEYRLEIKVNDKVSGKTLTRDVRFTVTP
jgi:hypothetical protein